MCGICGAWHYKQQESVSEQTIRRMSDVIVHRGPDDSGVHIDETANIGLGFRRLSIIDLSPAGHQPMCNEDGSIWLAFNGEIYNFPELRPALLAKGHHFRSQTDSEVILHLYEERGPEFVHELNGMFGLAIWDANKQRLLLARDRVGKKPLYYYDDGTRFVFASELKSIVADRSIARELDLTAMQEYLSLGYVPPPRTIFRNICKLPPGHLLILENGQIQTSQYWDWLTDFHSKEAYSEEEWCERLRSQLTISVKERMLSDVPLGAFLSGGVDSSAVVAAMARSSEQPVKTFSIGFTDKKYNELPYARMVAQKYATDHHEQIVEPEALQDVMSKLAWQFDEPFADSSAVPTYYVSKMARQNVTVILSGDGGDEAFAGYERYAQAMSEAYMDHIPLGLRRLFFAWPATKLPAGIRGKNLAARMMLTADQRYVTRMVRLHPPQISEFIQPEFLPSQNEKPNFLMGLMSEAQNLDYLSRIQYVDAMSYLPEDILVKVDRTSMLNSLEARCPLLDYRFLKIAASVPSSLRMVNGQGKYIFKQSLRDWIPAEILDRQKMGFGIPLREWFRDDLHAYAAEVLLDGGAKKRGMFQAESIEKLLQQHKHGMHTSEVAIWTLLMLELWCCNYLDG